MADRVSPKTHSGNDSIHTTVTHFQAIERGTVQNAKADKPKDLQFIYGGGYDDRSNFIGVKYAPPCMKVNSTIQYFLLDESDVRYHCSKLKFKKGKNKVTRLSKGQVQETVTRFITLPKGAIAFATAVESFLEIHKRQGEIDISRDPAAVKKWWETLCTLLECTVVWIEVNDGVTKIQKVLKVCSIPFYPQKSMKRLHRPKYRLLSGYR